MCQQARERNNARERQQGQLREEGRDLDALKRRYTELQRRVEVGVKEGKISKG